MAVRNEVQQFVDLGPLPNESADEDIIERHQLLLEKIKPPVTREEAAMLMSAFGPDDCYGLAWTLLHLIESAPGGPPLDTTRPPPGSNEWLLYLWDRSHRV